ncbi:hypothetical protein SAMN05421854_110195 [Amycolatopsis rubida]|uniref:Uncharacterized protein n=1 Tax=Amycolatopsis rubida TaxID=112413 RepID=A0A1I5XFC8_9PSEU|nr:hypothetical protein SAMN05421854_110195 [Amycolatopsis rubida]
MGPALVRVESRSARRACGVGSRLGCRSFGGQPVAARAGMERRDREEEGRSAGGTQTCAASRAARGPSADAARRPVPGARRRRLLGRHRRHRGFGGLGGGLVRPRRGRLFRAQPAVRASADGRAVRGGAAAPSAARENCRGNAAARPRAGARFLTAVPGSTARRGRRPGPETVAVSGPGSRHLAGRCVIAGRASALRSGRLLRQPGPAVRASRAAGRRRRGRAWPARRPGCVRCVWRPRALGRRTVPAR